VVIRSKSDYNRAHIIFRNAWIASACPAPAPLCPPIFAKFSENGGMKEGRAEAGVP